MTNLTNPKSKYITIIKRCIINVFVRLFIHDNIKVNAIKNGHNSLFFSYSVMLNLNFFINVEDKESKFIRISIIYNIQVTNNNSMGTILCG